MREPVITVKNISKSYNISHEMKANTGTVTFRDAIINTLKKPKELLTGHLMKKEKFWALKGIDFEINKGEVVGIIGKNGSGKSTLLKIMSRITEPTTGEIVMNGRVASLLEVGTGFHPELTGRENVYFNGSILGMKKKEIDAKFDEIVAFSEVEKFLDTPVKFYSSGMYVRLAFAVAAHLDPDILIVDEVLAVGDAAFQKKCLGKMKQSAAEGRTVLFVSHSMSSVSKLCKKAIFLKNGKVVKHGPVEKVIDAYSREDLDIGPTRKFIKPRGSEIFLQDASIVDLKNKKNNILNFGDGFNIEINVKSSRQIDNIRVGIGMMHEDIAIRTVWSEPSSINAGLYKFNFKFDDLLLATGNYYFNIGLDHHRENIQYFDNALNIEITEGIKNKTNANVLADYSSNSGIIKNQPGYTLEKA
ncbi:hypothetical protein LBMAG34_0040 [Candidatus Saccharibacteria bacterium]|nr:hypothetical protein LBMAG34_0040 [Candidatus Saccharibacteria bacterium]